MKFSDNEERVKLNNGMEVIVKRIRGAPTAYIVLLVDCGSLYEDARINGISHFLEHLIGEEGKVRQKRDRLLYKIERTGAETTAYVGHQFTEYQLDTPSASLSFNLRLFLNMFSALRFSEEDFARERQVILREIDVDQAELNFSSEAKKRVFGSHPLSLDMAGKKHNIANIITPQMVRLWHERFYQPQRMTLVVVGDVLLKKILRIVKRSSIGCLHNRNSELVLPKKIELNWDSGGIIEGINLNKTRIIFPMPDNPTDDVLFYFLQYIFEDNSTISINWDVERKLGIYDGICVEDCRTICGSYYEADLTAPSHKLLKKLEKKFLQWIDRVCKRGFSRDGFTRIKNRRKQDLSERMVREGNWWRENYVDSIVYHRPDRKMFEDMTFFDKKEMERVFREYFGGKRLMFRSLKRKK